MLFQKLYLRLLSIERAWAQDTPGNTGGGGPITPGNTTGGPIEIPDISSIDPLSGKGVGEIIANIGNYLLTTIAPALVVLMIIWGAFQMMTAAGNSEQFQKGLKTLKYAVIGFIIVLLANGVVGLIKNIITGK